MSTTLTPETITFHRTDAPNHFSTRLSSGDPVVVTVTDIDEVVFEIREDHPVVVNGIALYGRGYAKRRDYERSPWYLTNLHIYRVPADGKSRWHTPDPTDNQRSKVYSTFIDLAAALSATQLLAGQTAALQRDATRKAAEVESAQEALLAAQAALHAATAAYESSVLA